MSTARHTLSATSLFKTAATFTSAAALTACAIAPAAPPIIAGTHHARNDDVVLNQLHGGWQVDPTSTLNLLVKSNSPVPQLQRSRVAIRRPISEGEAQIFESCRKNKDAKFYTQCATPSPPNYLVYEHEQAPQLVYAHVRCNAPTMARVAEPGMSGGGAYLRATCATDGAYDVKSSYIPQRTTIVPPNTLIRMAPMITARTASACSALALMAGCTTTYQTQAYTPAYEVRTAPAVLSYPQGQTFETRLAWKGPETLGNCVGYERASAGPVPAQDSAAVAQALQMDGTTTATFTGMSRTGFTLACGYGNAAAQVPAPATKIRPAANGKAAAAAVPAFNNVRIAKTGPYFMASSFTQCTATLVMVQPGALASGEMPKMVYGPTTLPEFGGYQIPAGWATPKGTIRYNGFEQGNSLRCDHALTTVRPNVTSILQNN